MNENEKIKFLENIHFKKWTEEGKKKMILTFYYFYTKNNVMFIKKMFKNFR